MAKQLGVWSVTTGFNVPSEAKYVVATTPAYGGPAELLYNPDFEQGLLGWTMATPSDTTPLQADIRPGYVGDSVVLNSNELVYKGGLSQNFRDVPPNTTFHFKAMVKTVDIEALRTRLLTFSVTTTDRVWIEGKYLGYIEGSNDWTLYEFSYTTPDYPTLITVLPVLVYNRGEVWIDEVSLTIEGWQPPTAPAILNWWRMHRGVAPWNPFVTEADLNTVEEALKAVPIENFWGIIHIAEEHYRIHVEFNDDVNTTWFGEVMLGYPLYLAEAPNATIDDWMDEMWLRMVRGFYNYFHPLMKVGITINAGSVIVGYKGRASALGIPTYWGTPALNFITEHYDFVILYAYTTNLQFFNDWTKPYFELIDQLFTKQKKFWILSNDREGWEPEVMALELKNAFDRNMVTMIYPYKKPPFEEIWPLMLNAIELYDARTPYTESIVNDTNLLTGYVGDTYGWVANPEHDEGLYPTPISPTDMLIRAALSAATGIGLILIFL